MLAELDEAEKIRPGRLVDDVMARLMRLDRIAEARMAKSLTQERILAVIKSVGSAKDALDLKQLFGLAS